jgi:hypothetical protein
MKKGRRRGIPVWHFGNKIGSLPIACAKLRQFYIAYRANFDMFGRRNRGSLQFRLHGFEAGDAALQQKTQIRIKLLTGGQK